MEPLINEQKVTLANMGEFERTQIFLAWVRGDSLEHIGAKGDWVSQHISGSLYKNGTYRIPPNPVDVPWHVLQEDIQWVAMDSDKCFYGYTVEPEKKDGVWYSVDEVCYDLQCIKINANNNTWDSSLTRRP